MFGKNDHNNGDFYGSPDDAGPQNRDENFGKVAPDKEPAYYEETQMFQRPENRKNPAAEKPVQGGYPQNNHNHYAQGGYPQNNQNQYAQGGYPQNNHNQYAQGGYPQNNHNQYAQGGYPQNNQNQYAQGGYPQNNHNRYAQSGYPQNNQNQYSQGGYPQNSRDPYRQGGGNPYQRERREPVHNEPVNDKKKPGKKKNGMKVSTAVLIIVTLAVVLLGAVPAALIFFLKDRDKDSDKSSGKEAASTTAVISETETEPETEEDTAETETETETDAMEEFAEVPDVEGVDYRTAELKLKQAGFKTYCKNEYSSEVDENKVISQDQKPGVKAKRGKLIKLTVSLGPDPNESTEAEAGEEVEVPEVKGLKVEEAINKLRASGLDYEVVYTEITDDTDNANIGIVTSQSPSYGIKRAKGTKIVLNAVKKADKTPVTTGKVVTEETELNVRKEPNTNSDILGRLPKDSNVDIIFEIDGWYAVMYNGETAYVSKEYVELNDKSVKIPQKR